ncbi:MAG: hypothetical protein HC923_05525 [Myxococcales bacterium]|nr:hypothetical protein [Myxococcales bacterium]
MPEKTRLMVLAPVIRQKKGHHKDIVDKLLSEGFVRARVNGEVVDLQSGLRGEADNPLGLGRYEKHDVEAWWTASRFGPKRSAG